MAVGVLPTPRLADVDAVRQLRRRAQLVTEQKATTFAFACRLLPNDVRDDVYLLYLVFRALDDLVDQGASDAPERVRAVARWAEEAAREPTPEVIVLESLARRYPLPRQAVGDFCVAMDQDLAGARFATERELERYCYRVAGTVGIVLASLLGVRDELEAYPAAGALGMAMQRTNILRDIDEDAESGRVYISDEALARHGGSLEPGRRGALVRAQIARADELYEDGMAGIGLLRRGRGAITLAATLYREILREIERQGYGQQPGRVVVPNPRKLLTALRATLLPV
ncbi:MAG: phytoene/squalene synthase family protein [Solirubrobacterales bacterium]|nr:phytoene/squalene synthase family protein [Solirubrobacterales bacterium]MBV9918578.1 phytoene/squalene synthase family protein [Solirubrobacterales bacterium]